MVSLGRWERDGVTPQCMERLCSRATEQRQPTVNEPAHRSISWCRPAPPLASNACIVSTESHQYDVCGCQCQGRSASVIVRVCISQTPSQRSVRVTVCAVCPQPLSPVVPVLRGSCVRAGSTSLVPAVGVARHTRRTCYSLGCWPPRHKSEHRPRRKV